MSNDRIFRAFINPLQFLQMEDTLQSGSNNELTSDSIVSFLCTPNMDCDSESLKKRYALINDPKNYLLAAPADERILKKLIWPLRQAKGNFMLGNYLSTISLSGLVGEMVAILLFDINEIKLNETLLSEKDQINKFGATFEKLGQRKRLDVLFSFRIIDNELKKEFNNIREIRRKYLHFWSQEHSNIQSDANAAFQSAVKIVLNLIGQNIKQGKILVNPVFQKYLEKLGLLNNV